MLKSFLLLPLGLLPFSLNSSDGIRFNGAIGHAGLFRHKLPGGLLLAWIRRARLTRVKLSMALWGPPTGMKIGAVRGALA
jgi:hypothetical protein